MQSMLLIVGLVATFTFGFYVVRAFGRFLDENQMADKQDPNSGHLTEQVEKQDGK